MARASPVPSDDNSDSGVVQQHTEATKGKPQKSVEAMDVDDQTDENGSEGSGEEEYEIERILDAKRGSFPEGRMGYFVKWKGYAESENSWVDERDAGNAHDLIEDYWKRNPKKARKSDVKTPKRGRQSKGGEEVDAQVKKRGRKSQAAESEGGDNAEASEPRVTKKARKNGVAEKQDDSMQSDDEEIVFRDLSDYKDLPTWEDLVDRVDTIERQDDGELVIYFLLKSGERARELSSVCRERFPQAMITFYEGNLRWKSTQ